MKITSARYTEVAVDRFPAYNNRSANLKLKESGWKIRSTMVDASNLKHELLNRLRSIMAANVLRASDLTERNECYFKWYSCLGSGNCLSSQNLVPKDLNLHLCCFKSFRSYRKEWTLFPHTVWTLANRYRRLYSFCFSMCFSFKTVG
jgi:hypothetical protein